MSKSLFKKTTIALAVVGALTSTVATAENFTFTADVTNFEVKIDSSGKVVSGLQESLIPTNVEDITISVAKNDSGNYAAQPIHFLENAKLSGRDIVLNNGDHSYTTINDTNEINGRNISMISLTANGGEVTASETLTLASHSEFKGDVLINAKKLLNKAALDAYDSAQIAVDVLSTESTVTLYGNSEFNGLQTIVFDGTGKPRIQLMGTKSLSVEELIVKNTGGEAILVDKMTNTKEGITSFSIDMISLEKETILSVYADSKETTSPATNVEFGEVVLNDNAKLNLGFRGSDFANSLGNKSIDTLKLADGSIVTVKTGDNKSGEGENLVADADVTIKNIEFLGNNASVAGNVIGDATSIIVNKDVEGSQIAKLSAKNANINVVTPGSETQLTIGEVSDGSNIQVTTGSENNTGDLTQLANAVAVKANNGTVNLSIAENDVYGALTGSLDALGVLSNVKEAVNTKTSAVAETMTTLPTVMTRILTNDLRKRLGDIRAGEGDSGAWVRYNGGELSGLGLDTDFHMIQLGVDTTPTNNGTRFGVAFSYAQSETDAAVNSDSDQYSLAAYGVWTGEKGQFIDVIGRVATIKSDLKGPAGNKADLDNVALSLSGEFGWRFNVSETFYVEPSVEATYTYIDSEKFKLGKVNYNIDSTNSLVGRAGFATGLKCPNNKGDVYIRVAAAHEFSGDTTLNVNNGIRSLNKDGKDTWIEYAIGGQYNVNKSTYIYADVERTSGASLEEDWRANVGLRYNF